MIKLLLGRVLPLGMCGVLLKSSYSPIKPALNAFAAATAALAGEGVENSGANFPGTDGQAPPSIPTTPDAAVADAKRNVSGALGSLFGSSNKDAAKAQLDAVIADVKYHGHPPADVPPPPPPTDRAPHPLAPPPKGEVKLSRTKPKEK